MSIGYSTINSIEPTAFNLLLVRACDARSEVTPTMFRQHVRLFARLDGFIERSIYFMSYF